MKRILILIVAVAAIYACSQQPDGFNINVNIEGAEGKVLLEKRGTQNWIPIDTADIVDGTAVVKGKVDYPQDYYLSVLGERNKTIIFVENSDISVQGSIDSLNKIVVTGSETHNQFESLNKPITKLSEEYMAIYQQVQQVAMQGDTAKAEELMEQVNDMFMETVEMQRGFVEQNPGSYVSPYLLGNLQNRLEVEQLDSLISGLDSKLDTLPTVAAIRERVEKLKKVAVGQVAPDFSMNDTEGNLVKFSDVYSENELTLLDFWAGWCGPCRQENPNVVSVYKEFKGEGFTVFGVSLDRTKEDWLKAIEDDNLTWTHVSDLSYWDNAAAKLYEVRGIPASFLVDSTGKIVAKNKRGNELRETVKEQLN